ncbi:MAG: hypothetical protein D6753_08430 [Planctomycetota bacterium]|nr:MAG: hypothetical protein D6753_08430 [Planctomycetota bacterium]
MQGSGNRGSSSEGSESWLWIAETIDEDPTPDGSNGQAMAAADPAVGPGALPSLQIQGYKLLRRLGRGGMGQVYLAERLDASRRLVALKLQQPHVRHTRQGRARFNREAAALRKLDHPHIARMEDSGVTDEGVPFLVLQYIRGSNLKTYCRERQPDLQERLEILLAICSAVQHAHERGVLHRDLKPENVLLDVDGKPWVADFGLACFATEAEKATKLTATGAFLGTLNYIPPEQLFRGVDNSTVATDIFGLGTLMYYLLTEKALFEFASIPDAVRSYYTSLPVRVSPPSGVHWTVPSELEKICLRCLHPDPKQRYSDVSALVDELQRFCQGRRRYFHKPLIVRRLGLLRRQFPWLFRSSLAAAIFLVVTSVVMLALWRRAESNYVQARLTTEALETAMSELAAEIRANSDSPDTLVQRRGQLMIIRNTLNDLHSKSNLDDHLLFQAAETDFVLARIEGYRGNWEVAKDYDRDAEMKFRELLQRNPDHRDAQFGLFHSLLAQSRTNEALPIIRRLANRFPGNVDFQDALVTTLGQRIAGLHARGEFETAAPLIQEFAEELQACAARMEPDDFYLVKNLGALHRFRAQQFIVRDNLTEARRELDSCVALFRDHLDLDGSTHDTVHHFILACRDAVSLAGFLGDLDQVEQYLRMEVDCYRAAGPRFAEFLALHEQHCCFLREYITVMELAGRSDRVAMADALYADALETLQRHSSDSLAWARCAIWRKCWQPPSAALEPTDGAYRNEESIDPRVYRTFPWIAALDCILRGDGHEALVAVEESAVTGNSMCEALAPIFAHVARALSGSQSGKLVVPQLTRSQRLRILASNLSFADAFLDQSLRLRLSELSQRVAARSP